MVEHELHGGEENKHDRLPLPLLSTLIQPLHYSGIASYK